MEMNDWPELKYALESNIRKGIKKIATIPSRFKYKEFLPPYPAPVV
jgi:hypothetical protein